MHIRVGQTRGTLTNVQGYSTRKAYVKNLCIPFPVPLPHLLERGEALVILGLIERVHRLLLTAAAALIEGAHRADSSARTSTDCCSLAAAAAGERPWWMDRSTSEVLSVRVGVTDKTWKKLCFVNC